MGKREFNISVEIDAPPERVWRIMADVERWAEWTPSVQSIVLWDRGPLAAGSRARIRQPKFPSAVWKVTALEPNHSFTWKSGSFVVWTIAHHAVKPTGSGCRVTLSLLFGGWLGGLLASITAKITETYLNFEATGLKRRSEELARGKIGS